MSRAARVKFQTEDYTQQVKSPNDGISFVSGQSVRGPFADPSEIINSWPSFVEIYGGLSDISDAPLLARRILEKGGSIRFSRVGHYDDPTDAATLDAIKATPSPMVLFEIDGPFLADNEIDVTINGDDIATVTFGVDSNTTYESLATAIKGLDAVKDAIIITNDAGDNTDMYIIPNKGVTLDVSAVTITGGASQPTDSQTDVTAIIDESTGTILFELVLKYEGEDGNNYTVEILEPSNGDSAYFKLVITNAAESIVETYDNLTIDENLSAGQSTFLKAVVDGSSSMDVVYKNLSGQGSTQLVPMVGTYLTYTGGDDGSTPVDADYIGDSSQKNGFHAFDDYDEAYEMAALDNFNDAVLVAAASYATNRGDLQAIIHLPITLKTKAAILAKRNSLGINTKFAYIVSGGITIFDPITSQKVNKSEIGDVIALASKSAQEFGPWYSFAGLRRGVLSGVLGVVNNFGSPATYNDLNDLANRQINMVITKNGQSVLWGNHSAQLANDIQSFNNVVKLVIYLKKALKPTLETFLEEPNDIPTWGRIYYTVRPLLDSLLNAQAFYNYEWIGDQDASSMDNLLINNSSDVSDGKYKVKLVISPIVGINEIEISIVLTKAGVTFEEVSGL